MYKIEVLTSGKYKNICLGARYSLTKKAAKNFIEMLQEDKAEFRVYKFIKCADLFCWSNDHDLPTGFWYDEDED